MGMHLEDIDSACGSTQRELNKFTEVNMHRDRLDVTKNNGHRITIDPPTMSFCCLHTALEE
jgi:hypothetical protein